MSTLTATIKSAVKESGWTPNAIANHTGYPASTITRFLNGETTPLELGDRLMEFLGLEIVEEIDWPEYVAECWPDACREAWSEYESEAWSEHETVAWQEALESDWPEDGFDEWRESEFRDWHEEIFPEWEQAEKAEWEESELQRLATLPWVRLSRTPNGE